MDKSGRDRYNGSSDSARLQPNIKEDSPMIYYVNQAAPREGNGSKERPFRHISDAAYLAQPGDDVLV